MFRYAVPAVSGTRALVVAVGRFAVVVDTEPGSDTATRLWSAAVAPGARLEDVLTALVSAGLRHTPDFAALEVVDAERGAVTIAVRGAGRATLAPDDAFSGRDAATWIEASRDGVVDAEVGLGDGRAASPLLPLVEGVVAGGVARWTATPAERPVRTAAALPATHPTVDLDLSDEETILGSLRRRRTRSGEPAESGRFGPESPEQAGSPDPGGWDGADGGGDADATVLGARRSPQTPGYALVFDSGRVIRLGEAPVVVGRSARTDPGSGARRETLPSPTREVSGTHAELRLSRGILLVTDLGSTNGTVIAAQSTPPFVLRDGASAHLAPGDRLDFGDGNAAVFRSAS